MLQQTSFMVAELVVSSVQACSADMPNLLEEEGEIVKFDGDTITDVAVRSGDRSLIRVQILAEKYQNEDEAKDSLTVREKSTGMQEHARSETP